MWLSTEEFLSHYAQHILPRGFVKMPHYGILANAHRHTRINLILKKMNLPLHPVQVKVPYQLRLLECYVLDIALCPKCQKGQMRLMGMLYPNNRGSPISTSKTDTLN